MLVTLVITIRRINSKENNTKYISYSNGLLNTYCHLGWTSRKSVNTWLIIQVWINVNVLGYQPNDLQKLSSEKEITICFSSFLDWKWWLNCIFRKILQINMLWYYFFYWLAPLTKYQTQNTHFQLLKSSLDPHQSYEFLETLNLLSDHTVSAW